jgi:DNA phosphorothioation-associated putative methyltransferase
LTDQAMILPEWHPYSEAAHRLPAAEAAVKDRPVASSLSAVPTSDQWAASESGITPAVCRLGCRGCYLALGKGKKSERHRTAIKRSEYSRPVKNGLRDQIISPEQTFLDYGCGLGEDCAFLERAGVKAQGWDPVFRPLPSPEPADVVNLGYIINVIENPQERIATLTRAFSLAEKVLIVAAYMDNGIATKHVRPVAFGDGVLTSRGTFQKLFRQRELRLFIESTLGQKAHVADFGVYYVFKDPAMLERWLADKQTLRPPKPKSNKVVAPVAPAELDDAIASSLAELTEALGRLPTDEEFDGLGSARRQFGGTEALEERIFSVIDAERYESARLSRETSLLVMLASSRLSPHGRPLFRELTKAYRGDIKGFFGSYKDACQRADDLLMQLGNSENIDQACLDFGMGKMLPDALYVHASLEPQLPLILRIMVGCARNFADGELPEQVTVLKIKRDGHGVTFIESEDFEAYEHPAVLRMTKVKFLQRKIISRDFSSSANPTIYHRKELFLNPEHECFQKFASLSAQEDEADLLGSPAIGRKAAWEALLAEKGYRMENHRLVSL